MSCFLDSTRLETSEPLPLPERSEPCATQLLWRLRQRSNSRAAEVAIYLLMRTVSKNVLRIVTGEVGEQRSVLDHAFFTLGEAPERILNLTAETALAWMRASSKASITPAQISEWLQDAVRNSVEPIIERAGSVSRRAIDTLRVVAHEMDRSDRPEPSEADTLLRDIPRFELGIPQEGINLSAWMFPGNGVVRARIKNTLLKASARRSKTRFTSMVKRCRNGATNT